MNASPFWPLVWKEYRASRAFWLAMVALGLVGQGGVAWLAQRSADRNWWLYQIALMIAAGFAVGIGGTLFAVEHEERTFGLLRVLPVRARQLGTAKLLCASAGLVSLIVALWLAAGVLAGWQSLPAHDAARLWGLWGLACAEGLAWGVLCSLAIRSPLWATVTAVAAATVTVQAVVTLTETHNLANISSYIEAIPYRVALLLVVSALDVWLLPRWLAGTFPQTAVRATARPRAGRAKTSTEWRSPAPRWLAPLLRLMWQTCGETAGSPLRLVGFGLASAGVCLLCVPALEGIAGNFGWLLVELPWRPNAALIPPVLILPFGLLTALVGSLEFSLDPLWRARFLAEHGVSPRLVWLSRQLVWGGLFLGLNALVLVAIVICQTALSHPGHWYFRPFPQDSWARNLSLLWWVLFSTYAVAQAVSMLVRRRLLAAVLAVLLGGLAGGWAYLMIALGELWCCSVAPLIAACLVATWLRAPAWLWGRSGWRSWLVPAATVAAGLGWLAYSVPNDRASEIDAGPIHWPQPEQSAVATADARATIELYRRARDLLDTNAGKGRNALELIRQASEHPSIWLPDNPKATWQCFDAIAHAGYSALSTQAAIDQHSGNLQQALDDYVVALRVSDHLDQTVFQPGMIYQMPIRPWALAGIRWWAVAPEQTAEKIRAAIARLEAYHATMPSPVAMLRSWYTAQQLTLRDLPAALDADVLSARDIDAKQWVASHFACERERGLRLLDAIAGLEVQRLEKLAERLKDNQRIDQLVEPLFHESWGGQKMQIFPVDGVMPHRFSSWVFTTPAFAREQLITKPLTWLVASNETDFRATLLVLALEAWRLDHGAPPGRLDELAPEEIDAVPLDPVFARPFLYYPTGVSGPTDNRIALDRPADDASDEAGARSFFPNAGYYASPGSRPFLWSALSSWPGEQFVELAQQRQADSNEIRHAYQLKSTGWHTLFVDANPAIGIMPAGRTYLIPQPGEQPASERRANW